LFKQHAPQLLELIGRTREQERDSFAGHDDGAGDARFVKRIASPWVRLRKTQNGSAWPSARERLFSFMASFGRHGGQ
jgi:hypothetical protein